MFKSDQFITAENLIDWNLKYKLGLVNKKVQKGKIFLEEGQKCNYFYYVLKGLVRLYYYDLDGHEITHWFSGEDMMITSPYSFFKNEPNIIYLQALEDTDMILITKEQIDVLISTAPSSSNKIRNLYVEFAMILSRRVMSIHTQTAEERYLTLIEMYPFLFQKAKLTHIASYLGITPQSLSRIRKNLTI